MTIKHPAQFTPAIIDEVLKRIGGRRGRLLDPFAGPGQSLARLAAPGRSVVGIEIERPWAEAGAPFVRHGDSTKMRLHAASVVRDLGDRGEVDRVVELAVPVGV